MPEPIASKILCSALWGENNTLILSLCKAEPTNSKQN